MVADSQRSRELAASEYNVRRSQYSPFYRRFPSFSLWSGFSRFVKAVGRVAERTPV